MFVPPSFVWEMFVQRGTNTGGDTVQENVFRCSHWGGDTAQNSKTEGGTPHKFKVGGWLSDYSANPGSS